MSPRKKRRRMWTRRAPTPYPGPQPPAPQPRGGSGAPALSPRPAVRQSGCLRRLLASSPGSSLSRGAPRPFSAAGGAGLLPSSPSSARRRRRRAPHAGGWLRAPSRPPSSRPRLLACAAAPAPALILSASSHYSLLLPESQFFWSHSRPGLGKALPRVGPMRPPLPTPAGRFRAPARPQPARTKARRLPRCGGGAGL